MDLGPLLLLFINFMNSGDASPFLSVCVSRCCHERQAEAHLQTPQQLPRPSLTDIATEPRQLVS